MKNTYQLSQNKDLLIVTQENGDMSVVKVSDIKKKRDAAVDSKELNLKQFDDQIQEYERQLAFVAENTQSTETQEE